MAETPRGILEKELLTGAKEICPGKCNEKGGCQKGGNIPQILIKAVLGEKKGIIPYESNLNMAPNTTTEAETPGKSEERRSSRGFQGPASLD